MNYRYTAQGFLPSRYLGAELLPLGEQQYQMWKSKSQWTPQTQFLRVNDIKSIQNCLHLCTSVLRNLFHTNENFVQLHKESMLIITNVTPTSQLYYANYMAVCITFGHQKYCVKFNP